mmetsp:Transcript_589/g.926  ORF Transcript_589/g.926 Transcript_589/m.926 type:complete len:242 (+) Transcript_589:127-852(+)
MGTCTTRPSDKETLEHFKHDNHCNDHKFVSLPTLSRLSLVCADTETLIMQLKLLRLKRSHIRARQDSLSERGAAVPWTIIEVRKGKDIRAQESCFNKADLYVQVKLLPHGPVFETSRSCSVIPKWYRLFELQQGIDDFTTIEFTVMAEYYESSRTEFGKCFVNFSDLSSQETFKEWLPITRPQKFKGRPELEVRVQIISDESRLLKRHMETCDDLVGELQKLLQKERVEALIADTKCLSTV